jgi:hypothetical protein
VTQTPPAPPAPAANQNTPYGFSTYTVITPTGTELNLQSSAEADKYEDMRDRYQQDNQFPNVSDLQDLDRLLVFEVMVHRWQTWIAQGFDYQYARVDESALKSNIKEYSTEIRLIKLALGIDKATRDKEKSESLADYVAKLLERAKVFGYHRNRQYERAVTAFYKLRSLVLTYDRCDDQERSELGLSPESILEWVRTELISEWDEIDKSFRKDQSMWIRDQ